MDPNSLKKTSLTKYDFYFQDDAERYRRAYEAYEQFQGMTNQEAEGSGSGIKMTRTYIPRDREEAEQRLLEDYFDNDDTPPKYPEENFRQRIDAIGRNSIDPILKITSIIRQLAYGTTPDAFDEYLQIAKRCSRECLDNFRTPMEISVDERCRINHLATSIIALSQW
nr:hypothetical protein [Tanacetum cinerariifolium]